MYKLSVIIPFYNGEKHFKRAFNSILNQSIGFENIEVILINDCSKDSSPEIARHYVEKYDNCKFIDLREFFSKNSGFPGRPRNYGLNVVSTDYVIFLDIDDTYHEKAFETLYNNINNQDTDLVVGNYITNSNGNIIKNRFFSSTQDNITIKPLINQKNFDKITNVTFISSWGKIFKTNIIKDNNLKFIEDGPVEDADFYFKYLFHVNSMTILHNDYVYHYNEYSDSTIHNHDKNLFISFLKGFKRICKFLDETYELSYKLFFNDYLSSLLLIFVSTKESKECKKKLLKMLHDFEKNNPNIEINRFEVKLLNDTILKERFELGVLLSNIYYIIYNSSLIKKIYRKFNNYRRDN